MKSLIPILYTLALVSYSVITQAQSPKLAAKADSLFAEWNKPGSPGAAVGVVSKGKLIYAKGFGEADVETGAPIGPETIFHVASVSKQFTAYAIVLLAQEGKLSLDDDIHKYLPEVPDFGKTITIRHLIHHISGMRDQWNLLTMAGWQMDDVITKEHIFNIVKRQRELNFDPGAEFSYSNTGYTLLAEIVSRVGKQPFRDWMEQRIFKPLGMTKSLFYDDHERIVKGRSYSFYKPDSSNTYKKSVLSYANAGATSLFTTVNDLARWIGNFRSPTVGDKATMTQMLERGRLTKGDTLPYAFALSHGKHKGLDYYGHSGGDAGFRSFICYFPKEDYGFIILSNLGEFNPVKKSLDLASIYLAPYIKEDKPVVKASAPASTTGTYAFNPTRFDPYIGEYALTEDAGFTLTFSRTDNHYFVRPTGQPQSEIFPLNDSTFMSKIVDAQVIFHHPTSDKVNQITLVQNGRHPGTRVKPSSISAADKQQLIGKYYSPELETFYAITLQADTLKMVHIHHGEATVSMDVKNHLKVPWWFMSSVDIVRDSADQVIGFRASNGRVRNLWFRRLPTDFGTEKAPTAAK
ncbi:serine hydrolase [Spirosoma sp. HMF4905]|uniref:Serine hydrolase n=1 Tax=Spirosoma arboris TaxID=2682092 RepID=A0A7K1S5U3_9BACT|nr:serine hydrolase domain-containing protein [Spirosoma arboris]MVM29026.1 serine hydrolase [Spirosoma arboris]